MTDSALAAPSSARISSGIAQFTAQDTASSLPAAPTPISSAAVAPTIDDLRRSRSGAQDHVTTTTGEAIPRQALDQEIAVVTGRHWAIAAPAACVLFAAGLPAAGVAFWWDVATSRTGKTPPHA